MTELKRYHETYQTNSFNTFIRKLLRKFVKQKILWRKAAVFMIKFEAKLYRLTIQVFGTIYLRCLKIKPAARTSVLKFPQNPETC